jgi:ankyrin repeat protein
MSQQAKLVVNFHRAALNGLHRTLTKMLEAEAERCGLSAEVNTSTAASAMPPDESDEESSIDVRAEDGSDGDDVMDTKDDEDEREVGGEEELDDEDRTYAAPSHKRQRTGDDAALSSHRSASSGAFSLCPSPLLSSTDKLGKTALHKACRNGHVQAVKVLLDAHAPILPNNEGRTPIFMALLSDTPVPILDLFVQATKRKELDADVFKHKNKEGQNVLHVAAQRGLLQLTEYLLSLSGKGIRFPGLKDTDKSNQTAAHYAAANNHARVLDALLKADPSVYNAICSKSGFMPIHAAAAAGSCKTLDLLIRTHKEFDKPVPEELTLFASGPASPDGRRARDVIVNAAECGCGTEVRVANASKYTSLHLSLQKGHDGPARLLLSHGASPTSVDAKKDEPIHLAAVNGRLDVLHVLLGDEPLEPVNEVIHFTTMAGAGMNAHAGKLDFITGVDVDRPNGHGETALFLAICNGRDDIVTYLLSKGASLTCLTKNEEGIAHAVARGGTVAVLNALKDHMNSIDWYAVAHKGRNMLHVLDGPEPFRVISALIADADLDVSKLLVATDTFLDTPLHIAVYELRVEAVDELLKLKAMRNLKNAAGELPLDGLKHSEKQAKRAKNKSARRDDISRLFSMATGAAAPERKPVLHSTPHVVDIDLVDDSDDPQYIPIAADRELEGLMVELMSAQAAPVLHQPTPTLVSPEPDPVDNMWRCIVTSLATIPFPELQLDLDPKKIIIGGQGSVCFGQWRRTDGIYVDIAVKYISDAKHRPALVRETYMHALCKHRNIIKALGITCWAPPSAADQSAPPSNAAQVSNFALVLERADGGNLRTLLQSSTIIRMSVEERLRWVFQLASALAYMHDQASDVSMIHGDLKPENVLVLTVGPTAQVLKLTDFGMATSSQQEEATYRTLLPDEMAGFKPGGGTPAYMSPEQLLGCQLGRRSDVWAFALLAYEILTAQYPWPERIPSSVHGMTRVSNYIASNVRPDLLKLPEDFDSSQRKALEAIFKSCWQKERVKRPGMSEVTQELKKVLQTFDVTAPSAALGSAIGRLESST